MPNKKKSTANKKKKQVEKREKQEAAKKSSESLHANANQFRELLLKGRKEYAKGKAYYAVDLQTQAIKLGSEKLPRFDDNSLIKGHALIDIGLAKSAIMTDFARGEERIKIKQEMDEIFVEALKIFEARKVKGTLTKFRKEECWIDDPLDDSSDYVSPVPHTERLGPADYLTAVQQSAGGSDPSPHTIRLLKSAINFVTSYQKTGYVIELECGICLQGMLPQSLGLEKLTTFLKCHEAVLSGRMAREDVIKQIYPIVENEVRHGGTREGKMKSSHKKLDKDISKYGLKYCANVDCNKFESHARQFATCSRCGWAAYCCRDCQKGDWKRHKKECHDKAKKAQDEVIQNKSMNCLLVGESQQIVTIVTFWHHFAATSDELQSTKTQDVEIVLHMIKPKLVGVELGTVHLDMKEIAFMWMAIWSMTKEKRKKMTEKFLKAINKLYFPRGGPDFTIATEWCIHGVFGVFAVIKHTPKGSILLHQNLEGKTNAYLVVGITQSIEHLLASTPDTSLPMYINTGLIPFKSRVLCQGTIIPAMDDVCNKLMSAAKAFMNGDEYGIKVLESIPC